MDVYYDATHSLPEKLMRIITGVLAKMAGGKLNAEKTIICDNFFSEC